jgi:pectinesterase
LKLDVFQPDKIQKPLPAILIIHGGGWRSGNKEQHHALAERLSENGYVCFTASYRLSTDALYPAAVQDLKTAIRWIRANAKTYEVDTTKIVALGFSSGAQLAALIGATNDVATFEGPSGNLSYSSNVNAIVSIDGILAFIHPESGEGDDSKSTSAATYWFGYSKTENPELWKAASALTYAGPDTPPTLFLNSSLPRFHAGRDDYIKELSKYNIYTEVHEFDAPHTFCLFEPWFTPTVDYITSFLKRVLK